MASWKRRHRKARRAVRKMVREAVKSHTAKSVTKLLYAARVYDLAVLADTKRGRKLILEALLRERVRLLDELKFIGRQARESARDTPGPS